MATLGNTTITNLNSGTIRIQPILNDYQEGIRIQPYSSWATIMLLGTDSTANTSGTSTNSWGIFNNDGNFYINKGGSNTQQSPRLWGHSNGFTVGNSSTSSYALNTASFICDSWVRTKGATGWYNESYGGGWYMTDSTYIRNYNSKQVLLSNLLTLSSASTHKGVKVGDTYINAIDGNLILQNNSAIRFGGDSWDYNVWAGLKYVHDTKTISLGIADGSVFTANNAQSGGTLNFPGIGTVSIDGALTVAGASTFTGKTTHNGGIGTTTLTASSTSTFTGKTTHNGGIGTTTMAASSNVSVGGTLAVTGASTFTGKTTHNGGIGTTTLSASGQITSTVATGTAPFTVSSTTKVTNLNADYLDGYSISTAGTKTPWSTIVTIGADGVSEMGRYIDFHFDNTTGSDYSTRLQCGGNHSNTITLPSDTGTVSLTSHTHTASANSTAVVTVSKSNHSHTAASAGGHTHTTSGTAASAGAHTHTTSGTAASAGAHTHTVSGTVTLSGSVSSGVLTITASFSNGTAASAGAHTHTTSGTAASAGAHTHTTSGTAAEAGAHTHSCGADSTNTSTVSTSTHTHSVPAS